MSVAKKSGPGYDRNGEEKLPISLRVFNPEKQGPVEVR